MKTLINALTTGLLMIGASAIAQAAGPTDAQIAAIVVAANDADIAASKLAEGKASSPGVKAFAKQMVFDHSGVNQQAVALATKLHVTPEQSDTSHSLKKGADENVASLKRLSGKKFDKAYVDHEVAYHQSVIDALDQTLIPNAQNAELKNLLVQTRPAFISHLEHARHVQGELK
jgi:putative membrane protein